MTLTAPQQQEVEKTVESLRTSTGWWKGDPHAIEAIGAIVLERDDLRAERNKLLGMLSGRPV